ncbi:MAG: hypothetical protein Q8936_00455 [Bacillota bacterium]|nr:hypothetical protein [Bacillota bacterium]
MGKKYIAKNKIISAAIVLMSSYFIYRLMTKEIPLWPPITTINYNGKAVDTSLGDYNWISKNGGSSYETEGEYSVGLTTSRFDAKAGDIIHISISAKPKNVRIWQKFDGDYYSKEYKISKEGKDYIFKLPTEKGEYVFNVFANWDNYDHNTSTIFRVQVK